MGDRNRGLYSKYQVRRVDGSDEPGGKHDGCRLFVLDLTHDPHAEAAILAYAESCEEEYPLLAKDLLSLVEAQQFERAYSNSDGFVSELSPELDVGSSFVWCGKGWEVVGYFTFPCCSARGALVRRLESAMKTWTGVPCPKCRQGTYTIEPEGLGG